MVFSGVVNAKCTHDHSIFRTIDGSTRELLAKQLKKKLPKSPTIYGQPLLTFAERAVVRFEWTLTEIRFNMINNLLWLFFIYCFYPCVIFKSVWYARHFEYSCKRRSLNDWKQTAQRLKLQERILTINKRNIIRWNIYRDNDFHSRRQVLSWKTKTMPFEIGLTYFSTKNPINKLEMNNRRLLIAAEFHFVHAVEKDS